MLHEYVLLVGVANILPHVVRIHAVRVEVVFCQFLRQLAEVLERSKVFSFPPSRIV